MSTRRPLFHQSLRHFSYSFASLLHLHKDGRIHSMSSATGSPAISTTITPSTATNAAAATSSPAFPQVSVYPDPNVQQRNTNQIIYGTLFGALILLLLGIIFFCGHRYHARKEHFSDDESFKNASFLGRLMRPYHFVRLLFLPNLKPRGNDTEMGSVPRSNTFPPPASRASTFDQKLPPYEPRGYTPATSPISEEYPVMNAGGEGVQLGQRVHAVETGQAGQFEQPLHRSNANREV